VIMSVPGSGAIREPEFLRRPRACHRGVRYARSEGEPFLCTRRATRKSESVIGCGGKKSKVLLRDCRNTAARRRRSFLRLPRRAFIGGLRYGQGRLYAKNARDALR
jgi:hypothetical protein